MNKKKIKFDNLGPRIPTTKLLKIQGDSLHFWKFQKEIWFENQLKICIKEEKITIAIVVVIVILFTTY
jgi:hypothetical protein